MSELDDANAAVAAMKRRLDDFDRQRELARLAAPPRPTEGLEIREMRLGSTPFRVPKEEDPLPMSGADELVYQIEPSISTTGITYVLNPSADPDFPDFLAYCTAGDSFTVRVMVTINGTDVGQDCTFTWTNIDSFLQTSLPFANPTPSTLSAIFPTQESPAPIQVLCNISYHGPVRVVDATARIGVVISPVTTIVFPPPGTP